MFDNIYIAIMNGDTGNIADWFDINDADEKRIITERSSDKNYTVLPLTESVAYMKSHPEKSYFMYGASDDIISYLKAEGFSV